LGLEALEATNKPTNQQTNKPNWDMKDPRRVGIMDLDFLREPQALQFAPQR